jgi:hypothetical protein
VIFRTNSRQHLIVWGIHAAPLRNRIQRLSARSRSRAIAASICGEPANAGAGSFRRGRDLHARPRPEHGVHARRRNALFHEEHREFTSWTIAVSRFRNGRWTEPEVAPFSGRYSDADPCISPDGKQLFFISNRPVDGKPKTDYDIWVMDKTPSGWGEPRDLGAPVNGPGADYYPSIAANGTLYFSSVRPGGKGSMDLYRARLVEGKYSEIENLGDAINTQFSEVDAVVAPDESFIIFSGFGRPDDQNGRGDLYISYHRDGAWTPARNLGPAVNTAARDFCPALSPDGRYLFFSSERGFAESRPPRAIDYRELVSRLRGIHNGLGNIYQADMDVVRNQPRQRRLAGSQPG